MRPTLLIFGICFFLFYGASLQAKSPPSQMLPEEMQARAETHEILNGTYPGALLIERDVQGVVDDRYSRPYHSAILGYAGERPAGGGPVSLYVRRFIVHAPESADLPLARRVTQELLLLYGENRARLRLGPQRRETVEVWLSASSGHAADAGGEQFRNQIYLYDLYAERSAIEWAREVAHEYGHYALPGVTGFTEPEEWANGVLGERLFLKWLNEDLSAGILKPDEAPFITLKQLGDYLSRQVTPLLEQIGARHDFGAANLARTDARAMNDYTGLVLYLDTVYGSALLRAALLATEPEPGKTQVHAPDFLRGALTALREAQRLTLSPPLPAEGGTAHFLIYLPAGRWSRETRGPDHSWILAGSNPGATLTAGALNAHSGGYRQLKLRMLPAPGTVPVLILRKL